MALGSSRCNRLRMASDVLPPGSIPSPRSEEDEVNDLVASLRPRLADTVAVSDVERLIREARADLGPVRVTTYLPILVERLVRQRARTTATVPAVEVGIDLRTGRVTA
jgi:hypothetical protein